VLRDEEQSALLYLSTARSPAAKLPSPRARSYWSLVHWSWRFRGSAMGRPIYAVCSRDDCVTRSTSAFG